MSSKKGKRSRVTVASERRPKQLSSRIKRRIVRTLSLPSLNNSGPGYLDVDDNCQDLAGGFTNDSFENDSKQENSCHSSFTEDDDRECVVEIGDLDPIDWFRLKFSEWSPGELLTLKECRNISADSEKFGEELFKLLDVENKGSLNSVQLSTTFKNFTQGSVASKVVPWFTKTLKNKFKEKSLSIEDFIQLVSSEGFIEHIFQLLDLNCKNQLDHTEFINNLSRLKQLSKDSYDVAWVEQQFSKILGPEKVLTLGHFKKIFDSKNEFFTERVFNWFDKKREKQIKLEDFIESLHKLSCANESEKVRFLFNIYDVGEKGLISPCELRTVLKSCLDESGISLDDVELDDLTWALFEDMDENQSGSITYEELEKELKTHVGLLENLSISATKWLRPPAPPRRTNWLPYFMSKQYFRNNLPAVIFVLLYSIVNVILFTYQATFYALKGHNTFIVIARGCGICLNFNCTFIMIFMFRNLLTWLRSVKIGLYLPIDKSIDFHKMVGFVIFFFGVIHTLAHIGNIIMCTMQKEAAPVVNSCGCIFNETTDCGLTLNRTKVKMYKAYDYLFNMETRIGGIEGCLAGITGLLLIIILIIIVICALPFVRRKGHFEVFYWSHMLYIPFWLLIILHCQQFWKWFILPGVIYCIERIMRMKIVKIARHGRTFIKEGLVLPSKVTHLVINRPPNFSYHPGDYIFINIPAIAEYEWHPFTISSAPELGDVLWLHIRAVGTWTQSLYNFFEEPSSQLEKETVKAIMNSTNRNSTVKRMISNSVEAMNKTNSILNDILEDDIAEDAEYPNNGVKRVSSVSRPRLSFASRNKKKDSIKWKEQEPVSNENVHDVELRKPHHSLSRVTSSPADLLSPKATLRFLSRLASLTAVQEGDEDDEEEEDVEDETFEDKSIFKKNPINSYPSKDHLSVNVNNESNNPDHKLFTRAASLNPSLMQRRYTYKWRPRETVGRTISILSAVSMSSNAQDFSHLRRQPTAITVVTEAQPNVQKETEVFIDGPYGTPSSNIFQAEHAVLIAAGIGVTPAACILQSIMYRYRNAKRKCPRCFHKWTADIPPTVMHLKKVDFIWINRDQKSFEWFIHLLTQLEIEQTELGGAMDHFLDMHMYMTAALEKTDMKAVVLQLAMDKLHTKDKKDLITGLRTRTQAGRPNWNKIFKNVNRNRKGKITVFFCGPAQLSKSLQQKCDEFGFQFRKENF